jgi:hypothetical protein
MLSFRIEFNEKNDLKVESILIIDGLLNSISGRSYNKNMENRSNSSIL